MISKSEALKFAEIGPYYELEFLPEIYRDDEDVVLTAVAKNGYALEWASPRLRNIHHVVMSAISTGADGSVIVFAGEELRDNIEFVIDVLCNTKYRPELVVASASSRIRNDKCCILKIVEICGMSLQYVSKQLRDDADVVLAAVAQCSHALKYASSRLRGDKDVILAVVRKNGMALEHALYKMRNNKEVVMSAVLESPLAIKFASKSIHNNIKINIVDGSSLTRFN